MRDQALIDRPNSSFQQDDSAVQERTSGDFEPEDTAGFDAPGDGVIEQEPQSTNEENTPMFGREQTNDFRSRWYEIQTEFIDDPRRCVQRADELVAETMRQLAEVFAQERQKLEREWDRGEDVSTENLRVALQRYRSFFDRLLSF